MLIKIYPYVIIIILAENDWIIIKFIFIVCLPLNHKTTSNMDLVQSQRMVFLSSDNFKEFSTLL